MPTSCTYKLEFNLSNGLILNTDLKTNSDLSVKSRIATDSIEFHTKGLFI